MDNGDYDFIIIGSGAGGGLGVSSRSSGKRILLLGARSICSREKENWNSLEVNARGRYNTKELWRNVDGTELHPHTNYYVGGNINFMAPHFSACAKRDFGEIKHYGGVSPEWPICMMSWSLTTPRLNAFIMCMATSAKTPPSRDAAGFPYPAVSHEPRIQQLSDDFARLGLNPLHTPLGIMLDEKNPWRAPVSAATPVMDFHVW